MLLAEALVRAGVRNYCFCDSCRPPLTANLANCDFASATVTYLGHVVGQGRVSPMQAKVLAVCELPQSTTKKHRQQNKLRVWL